MLKSLRSEGQNGNVSTKRRERMKKLLVSVIVPIMVFIFVGYVWAGMPNPSAVYCNEMGFNSEVVTGPDGGQHSVCIFPNGESCDAWQFLKGLCGQSYSYCAQRGWNLILKDDGMNSLSNPYAVCVDANGREVGSVTDLLGYTSGSNLPNPQQLPQLQPSLQEQQPLASGAPPLPPWFDWRNYGGFDWVTSVKDQSQCGSCWFFSAVGAVEAVYNIHQNNPNLDLNLSEEYGTADCNGNGDGGCCGGWNDHALKSIRDQGTPDELCMPYNVAIYNTSICSCYPNPPCVGTCPHGGGTGSCSLLPCSSACPDWASRLVTIKDYHDAGANNQNTMKANLAAHGPLSVCLNFDGYLDLTVNPPFGVYKCTSTSTNHCTVIVGWNDVISAWIMKNSWGNTDGPHGDGYYEVGYGQCGIESVPYWAEPADIGFPIISVPGDITFADTCVGRTSYETLNVCNTGKADLRIDTIIPSNAQFTVTPPSIGPPVLISPDFCFPFQVSFSPTSTGQKTATLIIPSNDYGHPVIQVQATGNGTQGGISVIGSTAFGDVCLGTSKDMTLTINNTGGCNLSVTNITSSSAEFIVPTGITFPLSISPGGSTQLPIRFQPTSLGINKTANITVSSTDPGSPKVVAVSGSVPPGTIKVTGSTTFGEVCAGTVSEKTVSVCDVGKCTLNVTSATFVPACPDFTIINNPFPTAVSHDSCNDITIRYTPTSAGPHTCNLVINSDDPITPSVTLQVTANTPTGILINAASLFFNPTVNKIAGVCQSKQTLPISNTANCNTKVTNVTLSGTDVTSYSLSGVPVLPFSLSPGETLGDGNLAAVLKPTLIKRNLNAQVNVTYESDPIVHTTATVTGPMCGEGVTTGVRILVTHKGIPYPSAKRISLNKLDRPGQGPVVNKSEVKLVSVTPLAPCQPFQYHLEYGTASNTKQLKPGTYRVTVMNNNNSTRYVDFTLKDVCDFNPNIVVDFP